MTPDRHALRAELLLRLEKVRQLTTYSPPLDVAAVQSELRAEIAHLLQVTDTAPRGPFLSHREGTAGDVISKIKKAIAKPTLPYNRFLFQRQASFNDKLVRLASTLSDRVGQLAERTRGLSERVDQWGRDLQRGREERLTVMNTVEDFSRRLDELESKLDPKAGPRAVAKDLGESVATPGESTYLAFEEKFRGAEQDIHHRMEIYLQFITDVSGPILDVGCGRGEWLEALREHEQSALGVDLNQSMVDRCRSKALSAEQGDLLEYLEHSAPNSYGAITSFQVVEHLSAGELERFLALALQRLRPGGVLLLETVNPHCLTAFQFFFADPTHKTLLYPETLSWFVEQAGFTEVRSEGVNPVDASRHIPSSSDPALKPTVERLNAILYGPQDFFVLARKPRGTSA